MGNQKTLTPGEPKEVIQKINRRAAEMLISENAGAVNFDQVRREQGIPIPQRLNDTPYDPELDIDFKYLQPDDSPSKET